MGHRQGPVDGVVMNRSFWNGRRVLLTGHTGFKGSWLTAWLEMLDADVHGISLPAERDHMYDIIALDSHASTLADLRNARIDEVVRAFDPQVVLHLAAQSTVHNGYRDPEGTFSTNVMGTVRLLDALRNEAQSLQSVVVVTTDKVYGSEPRAFTEGDRLVACDPYSGSKVAQEVIVDSYRYSFFRRSARLVTARAGNVIGGGDYGPDRLLPDCVRAALASEEVRLRHPGAVRPWQHVLEPLRGYLMYAEAAAVESSVPRSLNFGPTPADTATVGDVASDFLVQLTGGPPRIAVGEPDPSVVENPCLTIDPALAAPAIGWKPTLGRATAVSWTAAWYAAALAGDDMSRVTLDQISRYEELAR